MGQQEGKNEGAQKFDQQKRDWSLFPFRAAAEIVKVLEFGAKKYERENWRKGMAWTRPWSATIRHLTAWITGETNDPETGLNHLAHAGCEILFLLEYHFTNPELDDRIPLPPMEYRPTFDDRLALEHALLRAPGADVIPWPRKAAAFPFSVSNKQKD